MPNSWFTHLECSVPCGAPSLDPRGRHHLCRCGAPLLARYDLTAARGWSRESLTDREPSMWRYRDLMPIFADESPVSLGEGFTPLLHATRLGAKYGMDRLYIKDESLNPTNSFKARGQSAAITRARGLGVDTVSVPSAGNAGNAMAAYAARAGLRAEVFLPKDVKVPFARECILYGAGVTLVDGLITDAARVAAERGGALGWYDVSTLKEPYRIEGKKTMAYELAEQMDWRYPDWIVYPTGGGTGMVGMWKAFEEMEAIGWVEPQRRPRMVSVQADGCAPIVRAFDQGLEKAPMWEQASTVADGLRVPRAIGDFLILRAVRDSGGTALSVPDAEMVDGMIAIGSAEGVSAAPEGGAGLAALSRLLERGVIKPHESVVLFNTGGALKYLDVLASRSQGRP
ncbi:MAG TPA: threonine synthase [Vicinamibacterales bacterium]|nr:threonine synthase [Vicinamibacterales bacterium]